MEYRVINRSSKRITQNYKPLSHKGVDLGWSRNEEDNKVYANCKGIVYEIVDGKNRNPKASGSASWGNYVYVKHANGMFTRYAHLKKGILVKKGQEVDENTVVGIMGDSGKTTARHLHFEVSKGYSSVKRINPTEYLTKPVYEVPKEEPKAVDNKKYVQIVAKSGVWCRKGVGFKYPKYKAIPFNTKCELLEKNAGTSNGYKWDKIIYNGEEVFVPNNWNKYL